MFPDTVISGTLYYYNNIIDTLSRHLHTSAGKYACLVFYEHIYFILGIYYLHMPLTKTQSHPIVIYYNVSVVRSNYTIIIPV